MDIRSPQGRSASTRFGPVLDPGRSRFSLLSAFLLILSLAFLVVGSRASHDVCVMDAEDLLPVLGIEPFETISDGQLVIDATFTGVVRKGDKLFSTYDRAAPPKKRACPT